MTSDTPASDSAPTTKSEEGTSGGVVKKKQRVLSGIQPSSPPHLGNYLGAISQHIAASQNPDVESLFFIADYHALTTTPDAATLQSNVREVGATYLALGLHVERSIFFRQSDVPEVTELSWLLCTCTGMGLLERGVSYKDKTAKGITPNVGLFTYPVLQAADILIYDSDLVPVGKDQIQHIEMTQDMAGYFNTRFGAGDALLKKPKWQLSRSPKVPGTNGEKMSSSYGNFILIFLEGKALKKAVNKIVTDSRPPEEAKNPDGIIAYQLLETMLDDDEQKQWRARIEAGGDDGPGYGDMKKALMAKMDDAFGDARERYQAFKTDKGEQARLDDILHEGGKRARALAQPVLARCLDACGMSSATARLRP